MDNLSNQAGAAGADRWACGLAVKPRMMIWRPAADLAPFISGYHLYAVDANRGEPNRGAFDPAWASLRIAAAGGEDWQVRSIGGERIEPGRVALFGPSSELVWSESGAGILIGAGIRPRGWARLFGGSAREWSDRIDRAPLLAGLGPTALRHRFGELSDDEAVPRIFDDLFREALRPPSADDGAIAAIEAALVDPAIRSVADLTAHTGLAPRKMQRVADRAFGFPPKLLLRRARFLRSLHALRVARRGEAASVIDPNYTDHSHFIRDAHDFLGMSPQAFLDIDMPLLKRSLDLRAQVLGTPAQALDPAPEAKGRR